MPLNPLENNFYTYLWLREDGTPYYVGKGIGLRAFRQGSPTLTSCDGYLTVPDRDRILLQYHPTEEAAFSAEKFLIWYYGKKSEGGILINISDGGSGGKQPADVCSRISNTLKIKGIRPPSRRGLKNSIESNIKRSSRLKGHKGVEHSVEFIEKHRQRMLGTSYHKGFINSEESRNKMSQAAKNRLPRLRTVRGTYA
jgi:hypothetical protein